MVNINKTFEGSQTGGTVFNSTTDEDGRLVSQNGGGQHEFIPLPTVSYAAIDLIASVIISIVGIILALKEPSLEHLCRSYYIMMYLHISFWFLTLIVDYILKKSHHNLRVSGYLDFYQQTYTLHRMPIYVVSLWNTILLLAQTLAHHIDPLNFMDQCLNYGLTTPISYITTLMFVETIVLLVVYGQYIQKVLSFNGSRQRPDVQRDQVVGTVAPPISETLTQTADLLARQADLIRHLREHNEKLSTKLTQTQIQLRELQSQPAQGSTSPVTPA